MPPPLIFRLHKLFQKAGDPGRALLVSQYPGHQDRGKSGTWTPVKALRQCRRVSIHQGHYLHMTILLGQHASCGSTVVSYVYFDSLRRFRKEASETPHQIPQLRGLQAQRNEKTKQVYDHFPWFEIPLGQGQGMRELVTFCLLHNKEEGQKAHHEEHSPTLPSICSHSSS